MESAEEAWPNIVCIEYPGIVNNVDKMLHSLGGLRNISTAYSEKNRRLELRFRADDIYCKPVCGDKHRTSALVLKVKRKRSRGGEVTFSHTIVGKVETVFKFANLCDFQYLPMVAPKDDPMKMENVYDSLVPNGLPPLSWIYEPACQFLPPAVFSRMDSVQSYMYRKDTDQEASVPHNIIGRTRRRRSIHARFITFDIPEAPKKPREMAVKLLQVKFLDSDHINNIRKLFEERPVWSKNALMCITKYSSEQLKFLLPAAAYYFVTGPWRVMWVRYGYDPRLDPTARIYQTLDYRLRKKGGLRTKVKAKRSYCNYLLPYKLTPACRPKMSVISRELVNEASTSAPPKAKEDPSLFVDSNYIFRAGVMPPSRQMFYQYCDVRIPEIEAMLEKLPMPVPNAKCHERDGWLPAGFADQCREIINNIMIETLRHSEAPKGTPAETAVEGEDASKDREASEWSDSEECPDDEDDQDWEIDFDVDLQE